MIALEVNSSISLAGDPTNTNMGPASMESDGEGGIRKLASRCRDLFDDCLTQGANWDAEVSAKFETERCDTGEVPAELATESRDTGVVLARLETHQRRFHVWSSGLKVFSVSRASLDALLRPASNTVIMNMVVLLLKVLEENLSLGM